MHSLSVSSSGTEQEFLYHDSVAVKIMIINALINFRGKEPVSAAELWITTSPKFKGKRRFITAFTTASHLSLSTEQLGIYPSTAQSTTNSSIITSFDTTAILKLY